MRHTALPATAPAGEAETALERSFPFIAAGLAGAVLLLGVAFMPAAVVPWSRAAYVLEVHRGEIALFGAISLVALGLFFLLTRMGA